MKSNRARLRAAAPALFAASLVLAGVACDEPPAPTAPTAAGSAQPAPATAGSASAAGSAAAKPKEPTLADKASRFAVAKLTADTAKLPESEREALAKVIEAAKLLDPVFDRQAFPGGVELRASLAKDTSPEGKAKLAYYDIMRGPWDRQDHYAPFATKEKRPPGAGFYPPDLTADAFKKYVAEHPQEKAALEGLFTVVERDGEKLKTVPFAKAYAEWLEPAAKLLEEAAGITKNASLSKFLKSRAKAFRTDDYYQSDKDWMDVESEVDVTIGPYETYEDDLFGFKASYEAFILVQDKAESDKLSKYKKMLPDWEKNLPIPEEMKTKRGAESPIRVGDVVFTSGDARKSVQTIAFNLPNDEKVRKEKGAKKVLLRNLIQTKFDLIMRPIAQKIIVESELANLSAEAFFNETLFHELSHSLGPAFTKKDGKDVEVRVALEASAAALEEAKADVMGAWVILYLVKQKEFPPEFRKQLLLSYFAGLFRSTRFGVAEAHGSGAALQINRYLEEQAATFDEKTVRFSVDYDKLEASIAKLVSDICTVQHHGDKAGAEAMLKKYGVMSPPMQKALGGLDAIPVDIRPVYPLAGE